MTKAKKKQPRQKHVPQRTCVVCREKTDKRDLFRVVNNTDEGIIIDLTGKKNGRGAYICSKAVCWQKATQSNVLDGALRTAVQPEIKQNLMNRFEELNKTMGSTA